MKIQAGATMYRMYRDKEPMPQWAVEYHARTSSQMEVFEACARGAITPAEGAKILEEQRNMRRPKWLRWLIGLTS